ncbi:MAG: hypothetical protein ABIJ48_07475 [Actinomycetota bacterium]
MEIAGVVFAADSVPAVPAVTREPLLVWACNAFAILGLRAMSFFLAATIRCCECLRVGLVFIPAFIGAKMMTVDLFEIPIWIVPSVMVLILAVSAAASWGKTRAGAPGVEPTELGTKA